MVLYNLCNGVLMKKSRHQYPFFLFMGIAMILEVWVILLGVT